MLHALGQIAQLVERRIARIQVVGRRLRDRIDLTADGVECIIRADDDTLDLLGAGAGMAGMFGCLVALVDQTFDLATERAHDLTDPIRCRTRLFSEALHLTGNNGKTTPGLTRARR